LTKPTRISIIWVETHDEEVAVSGSMGGETMRALIWEGPREMTVRDVAVPTPAPDEVLIRVAYCGICGSELSGYLGHNALRVPPLIMGHEFSGKIVALGSEAGAANAALGAGAKVTVDPMVYDGTCRYCLEGRQHLCLDRSLIGAHRPGAFAEVVAAPAHMVFALPAAMDLRTGALSEPTACAVRIVQLMGDVTDKDVLIVGAGTIGLLTLQVLRHRGAGIVFISDTNAGRLATAAALGGEVLNPIEQDVAAAVRARTGGRGVSCALDAVGKAVTRRQCVAATERAGLVLLSGLHEEVSEMPVAEVIRSEITLQGTFCYTPDNVREAISLLDRGAVSFGSWVIDAPLDEGRAWFERLVGDPGEVAKVLLIP
jgi:2-desacetyl-2-hydroxyethyl bacteriochlorophyllide A dehydrogenase